LSVYEEGILKVGIIGLGVGAAHIPGYAKHPDCMLAALCDRDSDRLKAVAERHPETRLYNHADDLLSDPEIGIVSIASYDEDHFEQVCRAISAGKHVFVEKPLCQSAEELVEIRRLLSANPSIRLSSNLIMRAYPRFTALRSAIADGEFGELYFLEGDYNYGRLSKLLDGWRGKQGFYSIVLGGGVHIVDLLMWLADDRIVEVSAVGNTICSAGSGFGNKDMVVATLKFESGIVGKLAVNFGCVMPHFHRVSVYGTEATFENRLDVGLQYTSREPSAVPTKIELPYPGVEKHGLIPSFVVSILNGETAIVDEKAVFDCMAVCFGIERAVTEARIVKIEYDY
tara:strand:+ start:3397 stop:4419 length:1023 start_codon:yes stop_codon:yes gene_type:complete